MKLRYTKIVGLLTPLLFGVTIASGQGTSGTSSTREYFNPPQIGAVSAVIVPDARSAGMADTGVATGTDTYSIYHNISKLGFSQKTWGVSLSYTPWLTEIAKDMGITYLTGYYTWGSDIRHGLSASFRYFDIGEALLFPRQDNSKPLTINPFELAFDLGYAIKFHPMWSLGATVRYLRSDLNAEITTGPADNPKTTKSLAQTFMLDLALTHDRTISIGGDEVGLRVGMAVDNIGDKLSYDGGASYLFSPAILRIGAGMSGFGSEPHAFSFSVEADKYLAPSIPLPTAPDFLQQKEYLRKMNPLKAIFYSFGDAPGGFSEELKEISLAVGAEYVYDKVFFARLGGRYQHHTKGNDSGISLGVGVIFSNVTFDVSYFTGFDSQNPLNNTMRLSLGFSL
ncbi:type IX secretion system outer membrane channel protein PorV [Porphyromonas sp.]|uniref:type IX secretion system outer membrane channel protein PorV n=1 Tax=Porphyromonas sp. TaxID=1924944 RepID=UPI0026DC68E0|nr:type IX secretion system outer membrane channel protein PorV [Porphyromonas sp.]MDO4695512.1 type IX secretion system outer membrane channel protein PorV [Porphyromonas sp.]MDO4770247.1 type IX secretion system outer membrane channel protein PorV [Porphyromonas sp.]